MPKPNYKRLPPETVDTLEAILQTVQDSVRDRLVPDALSWSNDDDTGLLLPNGVAADRARSSLVVQAAGLYTLGALMRYAFEPEAASALAEPVVQGMERTFWDTERTGWRDAPDAERASKSGLGHGLTLAALCEYVMATGNFRASELAVETVQAVQIFLSNAAEGGYHGRTDDEWAITDDSSDLDGNVALLLGFETARQAWGTPVYEQKSRELAAWLVSRCGAASAPSTRAILLGCLDEGVDTGPLERLECDGKRGPLYSLRLILERWNHCRNPMENRDLDAFSSIEDWYKPIRFDETSDLLGDLLAPVSLLRVEELLLRALY